MEFVITPDDSGKGRLIVDGRYYGLPLETIVRIKAMYDTLEAMTQTEECDCGCPWKSKPKLGKPAHYYFAALEALGRSRNTEEVNDGNT